MYIKTIIFLTNLKTNFVQLFEPLYVDTLLTLVSVQS